MNNAHLYLIEINMREELPPMKVCVYTFLSPTCYTSTKKGYKFPSMY